MANVGRVTMDREGTYIELKNIHYTKREHLSLPDQGAISSGKDGRHRIISNDFDRTTPADLLRSMQDVSVSLDEQLKRKDKSGSGLTGGRVLTMFANSNNDTNDNYDETDSYDDDDDGGDDDEEEDNGDDDEDDDDNDDDDEEEDNGDDDQDKEEEDDDDGDDNDDNYGYEDDDDGTEEVKQQSLSLPTSDRVHPKASGSISSTRGYIESTADLMRVVYGPDWTSSGTGSAGRSSSSHGSRTHNRDSDEIDKDDNEDEELFVLPSSKKQSRSVLSELQYRLDNALDSSRVWTGGGVSGLSTLLSAGEGEGLWAAMSQDHHHHDHRTLSDLLKLPETSSSSRSDGHQSISHSNLFDAVRRRCVTGGYGEEQIAVTVNGEGEEGNGEGEDGNGDGDLHFDTFEDLQTGEKFSGRNNKPGNDDEGDDDDDDDDQERKNTIIDQELREMNARKKANFKASFDRRYDEKLLVSLLL